MNGSNGAGTENHEKIEKLSFRYTPLPTEREFHDDLRHALSTRERASGKVLGEEGVQIVFLDAMISILNLNAVSADIWVEDDRDIHVHLLPKGDLASFSDCVVAPGALRGGGSRNEKWNFACEQVDKVMARVFRGVPGVNARGSVHGWKGGEPSVSRKSDPKDKGRDLLHVTLLGLYTRPRAADFIQDAVVLYDNV